MKTSTLFFIFSLVLSLSVSAQTNRQLQFQLLFDQTDLALDKDYFLPAQQDSIRISTWRFYISNIELLQGDKLVFRPSQQHFLLDARQDKSLQIALNSKKQIVFDHLRFTLGVDAATQMAGALGKDLDPINGMYWTWQSGYINCKIEGYSPKCRTQNHFFQYHLGGFQAPHSTQQSIVLPVNGNSDTLVVQADLARFFEQIDLLQTAEIMSPSSEATRLAALLSNIFTSRP